eukprot:scaffold5.g963.t1
MLCSVGSSADAATQASAAAEAHAATIVIHAESSEPTALIAPKAQLQKQSSQEDASVGTLTAWQLLAAQVGSGGSCSSAAGSSPQQDARRLEMSGAQRLTQYGQGRARGSNGAAAAVEAAAAEAAISCAPRRQTAPSSSSEAEAEDGGARPLGLGARLGLGALGLAPPGDGGYLGQNYEVTGTLGVGAFGAALQARRCADGATVCIKAVHTAGVSKQDRRMARGEVAVLSSLSHPNIVQYHECFEENGQQYIVMEFCQARRMHGAGDGRAEGDLERLIKGRQAQAAPLSEDEAMLYFVQVLLALHHVHGKASGARRGGGIIHRDVKPGNIFVSQGGILRLGDFGVRRAVKQTSSEQSVARTVAGTPSYFSPELVQGLSYNHKTDVWAAGCLLYELCALHRPFRGVCVSTVVVHILRGEYPPLDERRYSPELRQLVGSLLRRNPEQRPSVDQVLDLAYVRKHMRLYREHIQRCVDSRKLSHEAALEPFCLEATTTQGQDALAEQQDASSETEPLQQVAQDTCAPDGSLEIASGEQPQQHDLISPEAQQAPAVAAVEPGDSTLGGQTAAALGPPPAQLRETPGAAAAAAALPGQRREALLHRSQTAPPAAYFAGLQAAAPKEPHGGSPLGDPCRAHRDSPQSHFEGPAAADSTGDTAGSSARSSGAAPPDAVAAAAAGAVACRGRLLHLQRDLSSQDLVKQMPQLLEQMQAILDSPAADRDCVGSGDEDGAGGGGAARRGVMRECLEEMKSQLRRAHRLIVSSSSSSASGASAGAAAAPPPQRA